MLWLKRIICGIVALIFIFIGARLIHGGEQVWQAIGFCILVGSITLAHIAIVQQLPKYNFWITLTAQGWLTLYILHITKRLDKKKKLLMPGWNMNWKKAEAYQNRKKHPEKNRKRKEKPGLTPRLILK